MGDLKLPQLPDRNPIKLSVSVTPDIHQALIDYAALYGATYGKDEPITELIPVMLAAFMESDRMFMRGRRGGK